MSEILDSLRHVWRNPDAPLTPDELRRVNAYLEVNTPAPNWVDLIFVFGTQYPTPAKMAAMLFKWGITRSIVLTGGDNRVAGFNEAESHRELLLKAGVPDRVLIVENRSSNTLENVTYGIQAIEKATNLSEVKAILAITKWHHARRGLMTLKRYMPQGVRYYANTYEHEGAQRGSWHLSFGGRNWVLHNLRRIVEQLEHGEITEIVRDGDVYV